MQNACKKHFLSHVFALLNLGTRLLECGSFLDLLDQSIRQTNNIHDANLNLFTKAASESYNYNSFRGCDDLRF